MKKTILTTALTLALSTSAFATSYIDHNLDAGNEFSPLNIDLSSFNFKNLGMPSTSGYTLFDYVEPASYIETSILAFYTQDLLDSLGGDITQVYAFIDKSIEYNNRAFEYGGIGIRRSLAGIVKLDEDFDNDRLNSDAGGIAYFNNYLLGIDSNEFAPRKAVGTRYAEYSASYFVLFSVHNGSIPKVGQAMLSRNIAYTTASSGGARRSISTMAHELGHNDGMEHDRSERDFSFSFHLSVYGISTICNNKQTLMGPGGFGEKLPFFSDPNITVSGTNEQCGISDVADVSRGYRDYIADGHFDNKTSILAEYEEVLPKTGVASLVMDSSVDEANGVIRGTIVWDGLSQGQNAFVNVVVDNYLDTTPSDFATQDIHIVYDGQSTTDFEIQLNDDSGIEANEQVRFKLHANNGVRIDSTQDDATVTIVSDEQGDTGTVEFAQTSLNGDEGQTLNVVLNRVDGSTGDVTVSLNVQSGTADSSDVTLNAQSVSFADGETSKTVTVTLNDDDVEEGTENLTLTLSDSATGSNDSITLSISDSTESSTPPTSTPPARNPETNSGGGSTGFGIFALALVALFRRMKQR